MDDPDDNRSAADTGWSVPAGSGETRAWATPESSPSGSGPALVPTELAGGPGVRAQLDALTRDDAGAAPVEPLPLGPLTVSDLLDGAWSIIKTRPKTVYGLAALLVLPLDLVAFFLMRSDLKVFSPVAQFAVSPFSTSGPGSGSFFRSAAAGLLLLLPTTLLGGALSPLVLAWYTGGDLSIREALRALWRRTPAVLGAFCWMLLFEAIAAALFCTYGVTTLLVTTAFVVAIPALMIEGIGPLAATRRSLRLVNRRFFSTVWMVLLTALAEAFAYLALLLIPTVVGAFAPAAAQDVLFPLGSLFAQLVLAPIAPGVAIMLYLDLRVRTEGLDLDREAATVFPADG